MKKSTIITLIIAGALVLFGAGLFAGAMSAVSWNFDELQTQKYEPVTHEVEGEFSDISIQAIESSIEFKPSVDGTCMIECMESEHVTYSAKVENGTLRITTNDARTWYHHIGIFNTQRLNMTVYLPEREYGMLTIKASTGVIEIPENFSFESMDIELSTGDVTSRADTSGTCRISASTGDIEVENASVGALALRATTGKITASDVICAGNVSANVSTGKTFLTNLTCLDLTSTGTTGDMKLTNVIASGKLDITRDTGDVTFEGCDAAAMTVVTDTGDVKGTLLSDKIFTYRTDTGRVEIPKTTTGGVCDITTDTGDIILWIQ